MKFRKQSFNHKLMISYFALVLFLVSVVSASSYLVFKRMYTRSQDAANQKALKTTVELYEEKIFQPLTKAYVDYLGVSELGRVGNQFFNRTQLESMDIYQIYQYLRSRSISDEYISEIHLYAPSFERMLSSRFGYKSGEDLEKILGYYTLDTDILKNSTYPAVTTPFQYKDEDTHYYNVVYASFLKPGENAGYLIFTLDIGKIARLIQSDDESQIYILNKDGTILCHRDASKIGQPADVVFDQSKEYQVYEASNKVISMIPSVDDLYFVIESPIDSFYPVIGELVAQTFVITAVMLLIGSAVAFGMSRHISRPVEQVVNKISSTLKETPEGKQNLEEIVNTICDEFHSLSQFTEHSRETIKNNYIQNLYLNRTKNIGEMDGKKAYIGFSGEDAYIPALFACGLKDEISTEAGQMAVYKYIHDLQKNKKNLEVIASAPEDNIIAVVCRGNNRSEFISMMTQKAAEAGSQTAVYIGRICRYDHDLGEEFLALRELLPYRFFYPHKNVWEASDFSVSEEEQTIDGMAELSRQLKAGKPDDCMATVHYILKEMERLSFNYDRRQEILLKMISAVSDPARSMGIRLENMKLVIEAGDIDEFLINYRLLLEEFCAAGASRQQQHRQEEIDAIKRFIAENYDQDLSLSAVAQSVHMTPSYVSRFFKEQTGQNITEYVKEIKLTEAEKLLRTTDHSVEKIAGMIGYNTTHYFIRQFKEKYGETPTVYRKKQNRE